MLQAIIFDMDWVLVNTTRAIWPSFLKTLQTLWVDFGHYDEKKYLGRWLSEQFEIWKKDYNLTISLQEFSEMAFKYELETMKDTLIPDPRVQQLIHDAKAKWIKIAVGTSSFKYRAVALLQLIDVYNQLDAFVTRDDVAKTKPSPEIFLKAAELLHIVPENCIVIEDALNGIEAAKAAGMKCAGKIWPHHTREEFGSADLVFWEFSEIDLEYLENVLI